MPHREDNCSISAFRSENIVTELLVVYTLEDRPEGGYGSVEAFRHSLLAPDMLKEEDHPPFDGKPQQKLWGLSIRHKEALPSTSLVVYQDAW